MLWIFFLYPFLVPGAHNPERATPILRLYHGVFTDQVFLDRFTITFSRENLRFDPYKSASLQKWGS